LLVLVMLLNFFVLAAARIRAVINGVALQGLLLGIVYPVAHEWNHAPTGEGSLVEQPGLVRLLALAAVLMVVKAVVIPRLLLRAMREANIPDQVETCPGLLPTLLLGAAGTGLGTVFAGTLPLTADHTSSLIVPSALATVLTGFLVLTTRRKALTQVVGYLILENGIFLFGLLLVEAMPLLVEVGVLLDLSVGVFVMGIILNHVSRAFPATSPDDLTTLRE
jgi:hydrogenase-4 component E